MKNLKLMSMLFMATAMCCGVSSCRDDDESKADDNISSTENEMDDAPSFGINVNGIEYTFIRVDEGQFMMGGNDSSERKVDSDEKPIHSVSLKSYYIGQTEVTQDLWEYVMSNNPSGFKGKKHPVVGITWYECKDFIERLNVMTGKQFRLPTEAEWEFAAKGGNKSLDYIYSGSNNADDVSWNVLNTDYTYVWDKSGNVEYIHRVASKKSNELGIYDMSGNVLEWCQDWYDENYYSVSPINNPTGPTSGEERVARGGSYGNYETACAITNRFKYLPTSTSGMGFRLAY